MSAFPTYTAYKDSCVEWLGDVPEHWNAEKGKWLFNLMERPPRKEDDIVTAFRDGQVTLRINRRTEGFTNAIKEHGYQGIRKGDLVIHAMDAFAGAIGVSDADGKSTPVYSACVPRQGNSVNPHFYAYLLRHMAHSGFITTLAKGIRERSTNFSFTDFASLRLPLPAKLEQDRIVAFLDQKTAQIDALIAKKQRQIELLDEQKAILINLAVTRGLHPQAELQDSGIPWIGPIPKGWSVSRLKHESSHIVDCPHATPVYEPDGEFPAIRTSDVSPGETHYEQAKRVNAREFARWTDRLMPRAGDILYSREGDWGISAPVPEGVTLCISQRMMIFRPKKRIHSPYLMWQLNCEHVLRQGFFDVLGSTVPHVNIGTIANYHLVIPPRKAQEAIAVHVDLLHTKFKDAKRQIESQIQTLQTLRSTLIAHAVTGKIRV